METSALKRYLKSICDDMGWAYAIFWNLDHQPPVSFTWEEGYFALPLIRDEAPLCETKDLASFETDFLTEGNYADYSVAFTTAQMSSIKHKVGEGKFGPVEYKLAGKPESRLSFEASFLVLLLKQVVCTNCPHMIYLGEDAAIHSMEVPFVPDAPHPLSSIKTILLVPVHPYGVLQLGSFEEVAEDAAVATRVRENFNMAQCSNYSQLDDLNAKIVPLVVFDPLSVVIKEVNRLPKESTCYLANKIKFRMDSPPLSQLDTLEEASMNEIFPFPNDLMDADVRDSTDDTNFWISCLEEQSPAFFGAYGLANLNDSSCGGLRSCDDYIKKKPLGNDVLGPINNGAVGSTFCFPPGCELHKALGPAFMKREQKSASESLVSSGNLSSISYLLDEANLLSYSNTSIPCLLREKVESFLEAMVPNLSGSPDASSVSDLYDAKPPMPLLTQVPVVPPAYGNSNVSSFVQVDSLTKHNATEAYDNGNTTSSPSSPPAFKNLVSMFIEKQSDDESLPHVHMRRLDKPSTGCKKRGSVGENQRSRPRDRQLIQERLKELRELVPCGAKGSIDSLLDQTTKHMTFLGRVIKQAEKLAKMAMLQETKQDSTRDSSDNNSGQAMVFEGKIETYPIAVEDLGQPGHMLIKMKCNEHGLFLEMAQVISRLPLTILKGLLEIRSNDMWACFVVELTKGFPKMDIFWSLMQLLRRVKGLPSCKV